MRFVLIRHGQSENNLIYSQTGGEDGRHPDPPLTPLGEKQAEALATEVAAGALSWQITHVYSSLMTRAIQTAAPLVDLLDLPLHAHADLFECGGPYEVHSAGERIAHPGSGRDSLAALTPRVRLPEEATPTGWWPGPVEAEQPAYAARARRVITDLRERHDDGDAVALVTHGWFTQYLLQELLGVHRMSGWFSINNTGVSLLADANGQWSGTTTAHRVNWLGHLHPDDVTD